MRFSTNNVNSYLKKSLSTDDIVTALERTEVEVEEVLSSNALDRNIVTAKVRKVFPHPNADRLKIAEVVFGEKTATVVCGAPNLANDLVVAYAQPKTILPDGTKITHATIRGERSAGMLCSAKELGISEDHDGIIELDPDLPLGISLCDIENTGDVVDIKTPANRWDMLSVLGLAREISANSLKNLVIEPKRSEIKYFDKKAVNVKEIGECTKFVSVKLSIQQSARSPKWLVDNLVAAGMRSINTVVDITNYVMLETGQPSHAYDSSRLTGDLQVRFAKNDEELTTLDGIARKLSKADLVIADKSGAVALAGVMGGLGSEVDSTTTEILLEVANFNKTTVRRAALRHGIRTEASSRFEKGLPLPLQDFAISRLLYLFQEICGAKIVEGPFDQLYAWPWVQHVGLRVRKAEKFLGVELEERQLVDGLRARGFVAEHFSLANEAKKHLGKPYILGASYKLNQTEAFDCSYLTEYIYSLIGVGIGHTAKQQFDNGSEIDLDNLRPGDLLFYSGHWEKLSAKDRGDIGHVGMFIGQGKVLEASMHEYDAKTGKYQKLSNPGVRIVSIDIYTNNPSYKGARRYIESFNHIIAVTCPWWRTDISIEQDLFEEAAKILGYENMPTTLPQLPPMQTESHQFVLQTDQLRDILVAKGLFEVMTYSFVSKKHLEIAGLDEGDHLKILNPLSIEQEFLRSSTMMSHVQVVANNRDYWRKQYDFFEFSRVYSKDTGHKDGKREYWRLALTAVGDESAVRLKNILDTIGEKYAWSVHIKKSENPNYVPGRSASFAVNGETIGDFGQLQSTMLRGHKLSQEISFCELLLTEELLKSHAVQAKQIPTYQYIERDYTLEVSDTVYWQTIVDLLPCRDGLMRLKYIGEFVDNELKDKQLKRLSFRIWLDCGPQPSQKDINKQFQKILSQLKKSNDHNNLGVFTVC